ncbi:hypothetical protein KVR01_012898 [Diaporthe batatas]|uniref:uncharacterized protein n=1 Tax=Diaporthe batatas TaxID=748121 RepID=UPI001D03C9BE|nr:uncharacterized protein KVR01_012898 [Diaporthe batatas]KAG8157190.1 hypothetical protein KVR01_012898 [Diaporthe batatas]
MAPTAPTKRKSLRAKATERLANPLAPRKTHRPQAQVSESFIESKRDRRLIKHSSFVSRITKPSSTRLTPTQRKNLKRRAKARESATNAATNLTSLSDALPSLTEDEVRAGETQAAGRVRHKSLKSTPGALRRKERLVRGEMERFGLSLAQLSTVREQPAPTPAAAEGMNVEDKDGEEENRAPVQSTAGRFAALRGFIAATMEQNPAFSRQNGLAGRTG